MKERHRQYLHELTDGISATRKQTKQFRLNKPFIRLRRS